MRTFLRFCVIVVAVGLPAGAVFSADLEPDTVARAKEAVNGVYAGRIDRAGDIDWFFRFTTGGGGRLTAFSGTIMGKGGVIACVYRAKVPWTAITSERQLTLIKKLVITRSTRRGVFVGAVRPGQDVYVKIVAAKPGTIGTYSFRMTFPGSF
jgi:hypothetical protein